MFVVVYPPPLFLKKIGHKNQKQYYITSSFLLRLKNRPTHFSVSSAYGISLNGVGRPRSSPFSIAQAQLKSVPWHTGLQIFLIEEVFLYLLFSSPPFLSRGQMATRNPLSRDGVATPTPRKRNRIWVPLAPKYLRSGAKPLI